MNEFEAIPERLDDQCGERGPSSSEKAAALALKPCPFCGEKEELYPAHRGLGGGDPYAIDCLGCGIDFTPREGMDVVVAWNRRAVESELLEALKTLHKMTVIGTDAERHAALHGAWSAITKATGR